MHMMYQRNRLELIQCMPGHADSLVAQKPDPLCFSLYLVPNILNTIKLSRHLDKLNMQYCKCVRQVYQSHYPGISNQAGDYSVMI